MKIEFYDKLDEIDKSLLEAKDDVLSSERQLDKEIDMVKEKFMPIIEQKRSVVEEKKQELYDLECNIVKYSKFNINSFGKILATLVSAVEGIDYRYSTGEKLHLGFDEVNYFIKVSPSNLLAYNNSIKEHVISGKILLISLSADDYLKDSFYYSRIKKIHDKKPLGVDNYFRDDGTVLGCTKHFDYVYNFIDYMIQYKIENNLEEISYGEMLKLLKEYIPTIMDLIENKYRILEQADLDAVKRKQDERRQSLKKILEK